MGTQEKLIKICRQYSIRLLYLFGSQAEEGLQILNGSAIELSDPLTDLDLGVVFRNGLPAAAKLLKLYSALDNLLTDLFLPLPLDLVFLQEQHSVFQAEAVTGICIYTDDPLYKEYYEEDVMRRAADFKPFLEMFYKERFEEISK